MWFLNFNINEIELDKNKVVGQCIRKDGNNDKVVETVDIVLSDEYMKKLKQPRTFLNVDDKVIMISSGYLIKLRDSPFLITCMFHELGHYASLESFPANKNYSLKRKEYVLKGWVTPEEQVADLFAALHTSLEETIQGLRFIIRERNMAQDDVNKELALRELIERRELLKKTDENNILERLEKLTSKKIKI